MVRGCAEIEVAGERLLGDPTGALFWPDENLLLVADLHFEKGSAYAAKGQMLPPYDTRATLKALSPIFSYCGDSLSLRIMYSV